MIKNESQVAPEQVDQHPREHFKLPIRVAAFLFALIFASLTCIFAFFCSASAVSQVDFSQGFGVLIDASVTVPLMPETILPVYGLLTYDDPETSSSVPETRPFASISIINAGQEITVNFSDGLSPAFYILASSGSFIGDSLYIYFEPAEVYDPAFVSFISSFGRIIQFRDSFVFREDLTFLVPFSASVMPYVFTAGQATGNSVSVVGSLSGFELRYQLLNSGDVLSSYTVYSAPFGGNAAWALDSFRTLRFDYFVPTTYQLAVFMLSNENPPPSLFDRLGSGLTSVITWFGSVLTSLFTGSLAPMFWFIAVAVGVSLLGLGFNWLRRFIFGW